MDSAVVFPRDYKIDRRPQRSAWAPGNYAHRCEVCSERFVGDKRALLCADCAYKEAKVEISIKVVDKVTVPLLQMSLRTWYLSGLKRFFRYGYYKVRYKLWRAVK